MLQNNKIAFFLIDYSVTGGVEKVTANLSYLFNDAGYKDIHLITLLQQNKTPNIEYPSNIKIHKLTSDKKSFSNELSEILTKNEIKSLILQGDNMSIALQVLKACGNSNCNSILHYHGSPFAYLKKYIFQEDLKVKPTLIFKLLWSKIQYPFKKSKLKRVISKTNCAFVCVSKGSEKELKNLYQLPKENAEKIITIHNPIIIGGNTHINISDKKKKVSYVARLTEKHKNSMLIAKAWTKIAKNHPEWYLQIIGDGNLRQTMESFFFTGMVKNVATYLKNSSIAVSTSHCEGFGLAMAEAGYFKNALISTDSDGGITDIVIDNKTGILTPKNNTDELASAIDLLIKDENLRQEYTNNAYEHISKMIDEDILQQWKTVLKLV